MLTELDGLGLHFFFLKNFRYAAAAIITTTTIMPPYSVASPAVIKPVIAGVVGCAASPVGDVGVGAGVGVGIIVKSIPQEGFLSTLLVRRAKIKIKPRHNYFLSLRMMRFMAYSKSQKY